MTTDQQAATPAETIAEEMRQMLKDEFGITGGSLHARINKLVKLASPEPATTPTPASSLSDEQIDYQAMNHWHTLIREFAPAELAVCRRFARAIEALVRSEPQPAKALDDPRLQELFGAAISGAMSLGFQNSSPPPEGHWLAQHWTTGRDTFRASSGVDTPLSGEPRLSVERLWALEAAMDRLKKFTPLSASSIWEDCFEDVMKLINGLRTPGPAADTPLSGEPVMWQWRWEGKTPWLECSQDMHSQIVAGKYPDYESRELCAHTPGPAVGAASGASPQIDINKLIRQRLLDLLARIHGDGGHYVEEHGLHQALKDADAMVAEWRASPEPTAAVEALSDAAFRRVFEKHYGNNRTNGVNGYLRQGWDWARTALAAQQDGTVGGI